AGRAGERLHGLHVPGQPGRARPHPDDLLQSRQAADRGLHHRQVRLTRAGAVAGDWPRAAIDGFPAAPATGHPSRITNHGPEVPCHTNTSSRAMTRNSATWLPTSCAWATPRWPSWRPRWTWWTGATTAPRTGSWPTTRPSTTPSSASAST